MVKREIDIKVRLLYNFTGDRNKGFTYHNYTNDTKLCEFTYVKPNFIYKVT